MGLGHPPCALSPRRQAEVEVDHEEVGPAHAQEGEAKFRKLFKSNKGGSVEAIRKECGQCKGCFLAKGWAPVLRLLPRHDPEGRKVKKTLISELLNL